MQLFFERIESIRKQEQEERQKALSEGAGFNVFKVLRLSHSEVKLHSAFIAELLNPKGGHGMGDNPLKAFLYIVCGKDGFNFDTGSAIVRVEKNIGRIDEEYESGGQIDILIQSGNKAIIIENKIDAQDQYKQLVRYDNYAQRFKGGCLLLYLTLTGAKASDYSTVSKDKELLPDKDYYLISYKHHIVFWLSQCIAFSSGKPLVRETLQQYLNLINELTNNMGKTYQKQLIDSMIEHHEEVAALWSAQGEYALTVIKEYLKPAFEKIAEDLGLDMSFEDGFFEGKTKRELYLTKNEWGDMAIIIVSTSASNYWLYVNGRERVRPKSGQKLDSFSEEATNACPFGWDWLRKGYWALYSPVTVSAILSGDFTKVMEEHLREIRDDVDSMMDCRRS